MHEIAKISLLADIVAEIDSYSSHKVDLRWAIQNQSRLWDLIKKSLKFMSVSVKPSLVEAV